MKIKKRCVAPLFFYTFLGVFVLQAVWKTDAFRSSVVPFVIISLGCFVWSLLVGCDYAWDLFNHQLYLPFSLVHHRFDGDFFPVGPQSYQNPAVYLPLYILVTLGWPGWFVCFVFSLIHGLNLFCVWRLCGHLWPKQDVGSLRWRILATVAAGAAPVFLLLLGSSANDPLASLPFFAALNLVLTASCEKKSKLVVAGALVGAAVGLKLSMAVFAIALGVVLVWRVVRGELNRVAVLGYAAGAVGGFLVTYGYWGWLLWGRFGNPVFPMFNQIFHSPYVSDQSVLALRFLPRTVLDYVVRIWDFASFKRFTYTEYFLPDFRPLFFVFAIALGGLVKFVPRMRRSALLSNGAGRRSIDFCLILLIVVSYVLWMKTSANGRYGLPLFVLCGVAWVRVCCLVFSESLARILVLTGLTLQMGCFIAEGEFRGIAVPWSRESYVTVRMPQRLREEPFLHLVLGGQTRGLVAVYMDPRGAMINPVGHYSLPMEGVVGATVKAALAKWNGRVRILLRAPATDDDLAHFQKLTEKIVYRLGVTVNWTDCEPIEVASRGDAGARFPLLTGNANTTSRPFLQLWSCRAGPLVQRDEMLDSVRPKIEPVFSVLEKKCPVIFSPRSVAMERASKGWQKYYAAGDMVLTVADDGAVFATQMRSNVDDLVGTVDEVMHGRDHFDCHLRSSVTPD